MTLLHRRASARALLVMLAAATIVGAQPPKPFSAACPDAKPPRLDLHGDPLPEGAVVRLGTVRLRHGHIISGLVFAGDGKHIIASDYYSGVHVWDAAEGRELGRYYENDRYIHGLAISPDGRMLAVALSDLTVRLCDPISGQEFGALPPDHNRLSYLAFSPAGGRLATGTVGNTVRLWDVATRRLIQEVMGNESIGHAAFSPDGNLLAFDVRNGLVLWDIAHGKEVRQLPNEPGATHSLHAAFALAGGP